MSSATRGCSTCDWRRHNLDGDAAAELGWRGAKTPWLGQDLAANCTYLSYYQIKNLLSQIKFSWRSQPTVDSLKKTIVLEMYCKILLITNIYLDAIKCASD